MSEFEIWNELGNLHLNAGAYDKALNAYERAIELDINFGWPLSNLALTYTLKGQFAAAIPLYQKSIELFSSNKDKAVSWNRLGSAYRQLNDYNNAVAAYQKAVELDPDNKLLRDDLCAIQNGQDNVVDPVATKKTGDASTPQQPSKRLVQEPGANYFVFEANPLPRKPQPTDPVNCMPVEPSSFSAPGPGMLPAGRPSTTVALMLEQPPNSALPASELLLQAPALNDEADVLKRIHAILEQGKIIEAIPEGAQYYPVHHDPAADDITDNAIMVAQRINQLESDIVSPRKHLGETHSDLNHLDRDIAAYKRVTEINPENDRAWGTLGNLLRTAGCYSDAISAFEKAISLDPKRETYHYHLGLVYAAQKRYDDAIIAFQRVIELNPEYNLAHCALAGYYRRLGQETEAEKHIVIALQTMKDENEYNRACFEAICGNADQAIEFLRIALEKKQTPLEWVRRDPDLDFIRDDPRLRTLVGEGNLADIPASLGRAT